MPGSFSPKKDYRLALAVWATNQLSDLEKKGAIPGIRKREGLKILEKIDSCLLNLRESDFSKQQLLQSPAFGGFSDLFSTFMSKLGNNWFRIAKMKDPHDAKLLRFSLFNLRSLGLKLRKGEDNVPASAVRIRCSRVLEISPLPSSEIGKQKVKATDMEIKYDIVAEKNFDISPGDIYIISHLPPKRIEGFVSEGLLLKTDGELLEGDGGDVGKRPTTIPAEALEETNKVVKNLLEESFLI